MADNKLEVYKSYLGSYFDYWNKLTDEELEELSAEEIEELSDEEIAQMAEAVPAEEFDFEQFGIREIHGQSEDEGCPHTPTGHHFPGVQAAAGQ